MTAQVELRLASELRLCARASELADARDYAAAAAAAFELSPDDSYDFVYAVNEAVTNAIRHGAPDEHGQIILSVSTAGERLLFSVRDFGTFAMPTSASVSASVASVEGGRGFALMEQLVDDVRVRVDGDGTTVTLSKARM